MAIDIQRLKSEFAESMTCRDLARELGTDCETIRELVRKGVNNRVYAALN